LEAIPGLPDRSIAHRVDNGRAGMGERNRAERGSSESGRALVKWRSFSGRVSLAALVFLVAGSLATLSDLGAVLLGSSLVLLVVSCLASKSWRESALRILFAAAVLVMLPLVVNLAVYVLDLLGIVHYNNGGTQTPRLR
jgi:hypothetical protein